MEDIHRMVNRNVGTYGYIAGMLILLLSTVRATRPSAVQSSRTGPVIVNGYPEYHVNGSPFFPYIAAFFYHRLPADLWEPAMLKLKEIGFNTLDLYIIWNWHQPTEDTLDLDGHSNPRRNLKRLLTVADALGLKVILRPGPYIFNEWRNGGYPDWLMRKPGYHISPSAIIEGWFPTPSSIQYFNSESAARLWLENETHWTYTAKWFAEVWKIAGPFSASRGGPILAVQIDDDLAIGYYNYNGPTFWRYIHQYQRLLARAGVDVPLFINAAFMRDTASANNPPEGDPLWIIGQWYLRTGTSHLREGDGAGLQFAVEALKTQPLFPPWMIEFNTNQYAGPRDTHAAIIAPPRDLLLAARVLYQNGLRGMTIYPAQDTLYPAGWEFPPANYHYTWESALDIALNERSNRLWALKRDGALIAGMGSLLAGTHEQADVGLVYTLTAYPQEDLRREEMAVFARRLITLQQLAYHARVATQYIDLAHEPAEHLSRYRLIFLPIAPFRKAASHDPGEPLDMDEEAQHKLIDYVRSGGTLVVLPDLPKGRALDVLFPLSPLGSSSAGRGVADVTLSSGWRVPAIGARLRFHSQRMEGVRPIAFEADGKAIAGYEHRLGEGKVIVLGFDFFSWVPHAPVPTLGRWSPSAELNREERRQALRVLDWLLEEAGIRRNAVSLMRSSDPLDVYLYTTLLVSNEANQRYGFLAVTNWRDAGRRADVRIIDPRTREPLVLPNVYVPGRDALLLPVRVPLNRLVKRNSLRGSFADDEELVYATAEVTSARFANRILTLDLYAPGPAEIVLRMDDPPLGNVESEGEILLTTYDRSTRLTRIEVPAGRAPDHRRRVRVPFPFQPALSVKTRQAVLPGDPLRVQVGVINPWERPIRGRLLLETPESWPGVPAREIIIPGRTPLPGMRPSRRSFEFQAPVPPHAVLGSEWEVRACLDGEATWCSEPFRVRVVESIRWRLEPRADFPLRDDVRLPTQPPLWAVTLPGQIVFEVRLKNPLDRTLDVKLRPEGKALWFELDREHLELAPGQETSVSLTVWPRPHPGASRTATGLYPFILRMETPYETVELPVHLVGIRRGEALVYRFDFDRDGFADVALENEHLRAIVMPGAGGRAFALIDKATGRNALNTVGGLRDAFSKHRHDYTWKGRDLRRPPWRWSEVVLHNRPATVTVLRDSGSEVEVELSYQADDVFPAGATIHKKIRLAARSHTLDVEYEILPHGGDPEQHFRAGLSTSIAGRLRPAAEFLLPGREGSASRPFESGTRWTLRPSELNANWLAVSDPDSGDLLGLFWQGIDGIEVKAQRFSTLIEFISPSLDHARPYRFRIGYCFTHKGIHELQDHYHHFIQLQQQGG